MIGTKFKVETDHKPLVPLLSSKNLEELPLWIQQFQLRMMQFHFSVRHVPGKELDTADYLFRSPISLMDKEKCAKDREFQNEVEAFVNLVVNNLPVSDKCLREI